MYQRDKLFSPDYSVDMMSKVIESADTSSSGNLIAWDGEMISP